MCVFTVVSLMKSLSPISTFESPSAIRRKTSCSREVSSSNSFGVQLHAAGARTA